MDEVCVMRWTGEHHPKEWSPNDSWQWLGQQQTSTLSPRIPGSKLQFTYVGGIFQILTTAFPHPADHGNSQDKDARQLFEEDGRRFPLHAYTEENIVTTTMPLTKGGARP